MRPHTLKGWSQLNVLWGLFVKERGYTCLVLLALNLSNTRRIGIDIAEM